MDVCDWTSDDSIDLDALSPLPPLVIWTSRRAVPCTPPPTAPSYRTPYSALQHAYPNSGYQVATSEVSSSHYSLQSTSFCRWSTETSISGVLQDHPPMDLVSEISRDPRREIQRSKDTKPIDASITAVENPSLDALTSYGEKEQISQDESSATVNGHPEPVSKHSTGYEEVAFHSEYGNYSSKSADMNVHAGLVPNFGHIPVSSPVASLPEVPKNLVRDGINNRHATELVQDVVCQLQADLLNPDNTLCEETRKALERQPGRLDRGHSNPGEKTYKCKHCDTSFSTQSCLASHECTHPEEKSFKCKVCDKYFTTRSNLTRHARLHSGDKTFACTYCAKRFSSKYALLLHKRIHTGEKPYKCNYCDQMFAQSHSVTVHERTHTGERPYKCKLCDKSFKRSAHLTEHQFIHTGEKPYKCKVCGMAFRQMSTLAYHQRIHTGEKPCWCKECGKSFTKNSDLKRHERVHP